MTDLTALPVVRALPISGMCHRPPCLLHGTECGCLRRHSSHHPDPARAWNVAVHVHPRASSATCAPAPEKQVSLRHAWPAA